MPDLEKRFAPTETKIRRLRAAGIFPYSLLVTSFAAVAGGSLAFVITANQSGEVIRGYFVRSFSIDPGRSPHSSISQFFSLFAGLGLSILAPIAILVLLFGLLQNRFYFGFSNLFRPGRSRISRPDLSRRLQFFLGNLACAAAVLFIAWWFLVDASRYFSDTFLPLIVERKFRGAAPMSLAEMKSNFEAALRLLLAVEIEIFRARLGILIETLLGFMLISGVIARVASGIVFQREHGMTREELEAELREGEVSQQLRGAQRARSQEAAAIEAPKGEDADQ